MWCGGEGVCVAPRTGACRAQSDCTGTAICVEDFCREPGLLCQFNYECGLSASAGARACIDNACSSTCDVDEDCVSSGTRCVSGYCLPDRAECVQTAQCAAGQTCVLGRCLSESTSEGLCELADDDGNSPDFMCRQRWAPAPLCHGPEDCQAGSDCVDGVCRAPCPAAPLTCLNIDVQLTHCNATTGYCEAEFERTPECFSASDCNIGERCVNATCRNL
ncbi:MAG: hypothetical protein H5U40_03785 [Polyangiaceae bacterium]|nr:hypothetical protein [Polyangiaceae bacterium]